MRNFTISAASVFFLCSMTNIATAETGGHAPQKQEHAQQKKEHAPQKQEHAPKKKEHAKSQGHNEAHWEYGGNSGPQNWGEN